MLVALLNAGPADPAVAGDPAVVRHLRRIRTIASTVILAEIVIWLAWISLAASLGQGWAAVFLGVTMHVKHGFEAAAVQGKWLRDVVKGRRLLVASLFETVGAVVSLALFRHDAIGLAAVAIVGGIGLEHVLLIDAAQTEMEQRDICRPLPEEPGAVGHRRGRWRREG